MLLDPVINPVVLLNTGTQSMSRRETVGQESRQRIFNSVPVVNLEKWGAQLRNELSLYSSLPSLIHETHSFTSDEIRSKETLLSFQSSYPNSLVVSLYIELSIDNQQSIFIDDEVLFYSQEYAYHWSQRVSDANPATLIATLYINYIEANSEKKRSFTLEIKETTKDIVVDSSDLGVIDANESEWFNRLLRAIATTTK